MITVSQQLGIGLISTAIVLGYLFVCPKSPVKKKLWSVSSKLGITLADSSEVRMSVNEESLAFRVGLNAMSSIQVNKIGLRIGRRTLWSDWTPMEIGGIYARRILKV